jgi:hypothetical protein
MKKKNNLLKIIIYITIFGIFLWFEKELYQKYIAEKKIRDYIKEQKTTEIENSFLLRKKYFYSDNKYLKEFKKLVEESSKKGDE